MLKGLPTREEIDRAIAQAQSGSVGRWELPEEFTTQLEKLARGTAQINVEELRRQGYDFVDWFASN